ncbi:MAG: ParB N-terminal domain-containing protein [Enterococcus faecalis]|nr:ParB N-terminal domain-containing protein [Enterococcus faecalis]
MSEINGVHPYADKFPMLPQAELEELAQSIRDNGLRQPIVVTVDGLILDGRNRFQACRMAGVEPETVVYEGSDLAEYVLDANITRRNMSTGQRAMATALVLEADGRRTNGRWKRGSIDIGTSANISDWQSRLKEAGIILDYSPNLAGRVLDGTLAFKAAYLEADAIKQSAERDKIMAREQAKRKREEEAAEAEHNARIVADLTQAGSKYVALIEDGTMTPRAAWSAHREDTRKQREHQEKLARGWRDTNRHITEAVNMLQGGAEQAEIFLNDSYPHEADTVPEPLRLTISNTQTAIDFLTYINERLPR